jgi:hypothetical protein
VVFVLLLVLVLVLALALHLNLRVPHSSPAFGEGWVPLTLPFLVHWTFLSMPAGVERRYDSAMPRCKLNSWMERKAGDETEEKVKTSRPSHFEGWGTLNFKPTSSQLQETPSLPSALAR